MNLIKCLENHPAEAPYELDVVAAIRNRVLYLKCIRDNPYFDASKQITDNPELFYRETDALRKVHNATTCDEMKIALKEMIDESGEIYMKQTGNYMRVAI